MAVRQRHAAEASPTRRIASASRLISVWENTVPATTGSMAPRGPSSRRVRARRTRVGSPIRPGNERRGHHADHRRAHDRRPADRRLGQRGAQRLRARRPSAAPARAPSARAPARSSPGVAVISACPTRPRSRRESAKTISPASTSTRSRAAARPAMVEGSNRRVSERRAGLGCSVSSIVSGSIRAPLEPGRRQPSAQSNIVPLYGVADDPELGCCSERACAADPWSSVAGAVANNQRP